MDTQIFNRNCCFLSIVFSVAWYSLPVVGWERELHNRHLKLLHRTMARHRRPLNLVWVRRVVVSWPCFDDVCNLPRHPWSSQRILVGRNGLTFVCPDFEWHLGGDLLARMVRHRSQDSRQMLTRLRVEISYSLFFQQNLQLSKLTDLKIESCQKWELLKVTYIKIENFKKWQMSVFRIIKNDRC